MYFKISRIFAIVSVAIFDGMTKAEIRREEIEHQQISPTGNKIKRKKKQRNKRQASSTTLRRKSFKSGGGRNGRSGNNEHNEHNERNKEKRQLLFSVYVPTTAQHYSIKVKREDVHHFFHIHHGEGCEKEEDHQHHHQQQQHKVHDILHETSNLETKKYLFDMINMINVEYSALGFGSHKKLKAYMTREKKKLLVVEEEAAAIKLQTRWRGKTAKAVMLARKTLVQHIDSLLNDIYERGGNNGVMFMKHTSYELLKKISFHEHWRHAYSIAMCHNKHVIAHQKRKTHRFNVATVAMFAHKNSHCLVPKVATSILCLLAGEEDEDDTCELFKTNLDDFDIEDLRPALVSMYNNAATTKEGHLYSKDIQNMMTALSEQHSEIMFVNCNEETANILVAALDEDQNGTIEMEEFVSWLISGFSKSKEHRSKFSKKGPKFALLIQFMESVMEVAKKMTRDEMSNKSKESKRMDDLEEMREDEPSLGPKYIASNAEKRAACRAIFHQVDSDMSGYIDAEELVQLLTKLMDDLKLQSMNTQHEITLEEAEYFIDSMDSDGNMLIDCDEFVNFMVIGMSASNDAKIKFRERSSLHEKLALLIDGLSEVTEMRSHSLQAMYEKYEDKHAGGLTTDTLFQLFSEAHTDEVHRYDDVQQFFQIMDEDRNGAIDREEWCSYLLYGMSMPDEWRHQFGSKSPMHAKIAAVVRLCLLRTEELVLERTLLPVTAARTSILKSVML